MGHGLSTPVRRRAPNRTGAASRAERRSREDFFEAAFALLASEGAASVTAVGLCERLQVTRGSFYHHFASFDGFVGALLAQWESGSTTQRLAGLPALATDAREAENQMLLALTLDHEAEAALRVWAASHDAVAAAVRRVDLLRLDGLRALLLARGLPPPDADTWADLAVTTLIGLQVLEQPLDVERLRRVLRLVADALQTCWPSPSPSA